MSTRHLLPCACGKTVAVGLSQAGGSVACECGQSLDVPRLRDLRSLPMEAAPEVARTGWSFRLGVLSAGLMLAALFAGGAGWFAAYEPEPPAPFDAAARETVVNENLDRLAPADLFKLLVNVYEPAVIRGFEQAKSPREELILNAIELSQRYQKALLLAAAVVVGVTAVLFVVSPK